jgi:4-amino-4-deoxy-L-arabinose transferase-like glycosyltransferase
MITTTDTTKSAVLSGRLTRDSVLAWLGLAGPLVVSAVLNLWNLAQNGYDNLYYSVAVQSMLQSWHNFFFAAYDAGGFISVDKPPVALWIQTLSARLLGFNALGILLPQALAGVASVGLLYYLVRRLFGPLAASVAALALALTPIAVAVERGNNTDTWLMFTLLLAAWAVTRATEAGRFALLALSLALVGVAFNIKMLEAFIVLPAFYLLYLVAAPVGWRKRLLHLTLGTVVLLGVALSWPLAVDLTPPDQRPWVGGSQHNSVLELALGYNGLSRVTGQGEGIGGGTRPPGGFRGGAPGGFPNFGNNPGGGFPNFGNAPGGGPRGGGGLFDAGNPGPLRLFTGALAGQWSWLLPLALFGLPLAVAGLRRRRPLEGRGQAILLWTGWLALYGVVFSMAAGIFHPYYLIMLAPAAAALVGIGVAALWAAYRRGGAAAWLLPAALLVTAIWQMTLVGAYPAWSAWLTPLAWGGSILAAVPLVVTRLLSRRVWRRWAPGLVGAGLVALLVAPLAWAVTPVMAAPTNASLPEAGPQALNRYDPTSWTQLYSTGGPQPDAISGTGLVAYLEAHSAGYFYLVAVPTSQQASALALETGKPVLATAGFMGTDPALTAGKLAAMVADKQVRFVMGLGAGGGMRGQMGSGSTDSDVSGWIQSHCSAVGPSLYQGQIGGTGLSGGFGGFGGFRGGNSQLYDCAAQ